MSSIKVYISGRMTGLPEWGFPAFNAAAAALRLLGFEVFNPADNGVDPAKPWEEYLKYDLIKVIESNRVYVLTGWEESRGARLEVYVARALKIPIYSFSTMLPIEELEKPQESIIEEANRLVNGNRQGDYGHPYWDFSRTSTMWNGLLVEKLKEGCKIEPEEVGLMMVLVKLSRHMNKKKRDNLVDAHGYLLTVEMVEEFKNKNAKSK